MSRYQCTLYMRMHIVAYIQSTVAYNSTHIYRKTIIYGMALTPKTSVAGGPSHLHFRMQHYDPVRDRYSLVKTKKA